MARRIRPGCRPALAVALSFAAAPATATNGYFSHGYSAVQRALAGAGTAAAADALDVAVNPALLAGSDAHLVVNAGLFSPERLYTASARGDGAGPGIVSVDPGRVRSKRERFVIPALAWVQPLGDRGAAWGLALYGNGGMNTEYRGHAARFAEGLTNFETHCQGSFGGGDPVDGADDNAGFCGNRETNASVDLIQLFLVPSLALPVGDVVTLGVAPIAALQRFRATGLGGFAQFSNRPDKVTDNHYDWSRGGGLRVGLHAHRLPWVQAGISWQSRIQMTPFEDYAGLFAGEGDFDIPSNWNAGIAVPLPGGLRLLADVQRVNFSEVAAVGNPLDPNRFVNDCAFPRLRGDTAENSACLGSLTGPGFGWRDVTTYKVGAEWRIAAWTLRAGWSRNTGQPIPASEVLFNILAPAVPEVHWTAGGSWRLDDAWSVDASLMVARNRPVTGKNPLSNSTASEAELFSELLSPGSADTSDAFGSDPDDQDLTLEMRQFEVMLGLTWRP